MKRKILLVEDEKEVLNFLRDSLTRVGFTVDIALDGEEAIEKVKTFAPNLVVLDIILPGLDGLGVLKWIKKNRPKTYVILATAKKELNDIKEGYSQDADYYITKPYKLEEIIKGIDVLLSFEG